MPMGKLICEQTLGGVTYLRNITTAEGINVGQLVKTTPGVGKPFWWFPSIPAGKLQAADFTNAPVATADAATNNQLISQIAVAPEDVLTIEPPPTP